MIVLVTGDRDWTNYFLTFCRIKEWHDSTPEGITLLIHGGCRGADERGGRAAAELGIPVKVYPAEWERRERDGRAAGPIRNQHMINSHPEIDLVLAFHENISESKGTRDMVKRANRAGILVELSRRDEIVFPFELELV